MQIRTTDTFPPSQISNFSVGVSASQDASLLVQGVQISGNNQGIDARESNVTLRSGTTISGNFNFGMFLRGSRADLVDTTVSNNFGGGGIFVTEDSFVRTRRGEVNNNVGVGIGFDAFSHGVLDDDTEIMGNTFDKTTDATSDFVIRP